jgi:hypothetical protein
MLTLPKLNLVNTIRFDPPFYCCAVDSELSNYPPRPFSYSDPKVSFHLAGEKYS